MEFIVHRRTKNEDELYHHGIPNMKHGVRNGPPYPLSQEARAKAGYKTTKTPSNQGKAPSQKKEKTASSPKPSSSNSNARGEQAYKNRMESKARKEAFKKEIRPLKAKIKEAIDKRNEKRKAEKEKDINYKDLTKNKVVSKMSDKEIQDKVARINLEKTLKNLRKENIKNGETVGHKFVNAVGEELVTKVAKNAVVGFVKYTIGRSIEVRGTKDPDERREKILGKDADWQRLATYVTYGGPKPK